MELPTLPPGFRWRQNDGSDTLTVQILDPDGTGIEGDWIASASWQQSTGNIDRYVSRNTDYPASVHNVNTIEEAVAIMHAWACLGILE